MVSRFADIVSVEQFIEDKKMKTKKKTQQNVALLKEFLTMKNESRLMEEIPPKGDECIHQRIYHYGTKERQQRRL